MFTTMFFDSLTHKITAPQRQVPAVSEKRKVSAVSSHRTVMNKAALYL